MLAADLYCTHTYGHGHNICSSSCLHHHHHHQQQPLPRNPLYGTSPAPGICTAWSPSGTLLASAHQDGSLCVWDVRCAEPVHTYHLHSACRNVKFSPGVVDLMAFAEHEDVAGRVGCCWRASVGCGLWDYGVWGLGSGLGVLLIG